MTEPQKSVISTTENLDITFPSGENVSITKSNQCVMLNLQLDENNKNTYAADETPTPTRFIRNCEEVGLFQDLQNVNPFDETFKKAIELARSGSLHVPDMSTDDTLHTPHILPHENPTHEPQSIFNISRVSSLDEDLLKLGGSREGVGGELLDKLCGGSKDAPHSLDSSFSISRVPSIDEDLLIIANEDSDSEGEAVNENVNSKEPKKTSLENDANRALKVKLKEAVQNRLKNGNNRTLKLLDSSQGIIIAPVNIDKIKNADSATLLINQKVDPTCMKLPRKRIAKQPSHAQKKSKNQQETVSSEKEKIREMNRAAQSRSRTRKKKWIGEMVKRIDDLTRENRTLQALNEQLHCEISLMRNVLRFHSDCSATKDAQIKEKIDRLIADAKQKSQPSSKKSVRSNKAKEEIPIRPAPVKIQVPLVQAVSSGNVQVCVVPALNVRPSVPVTAVALEDVALKTVIPK